MWAWAINRPVAPETREGGPHGASDEAAPPLREALPQISAEFRRARRYERTVAIAVLTVGPDGATAGRHGPAPANGRAAASVLASALRQVVRDEDIVACDAQRCVLVMPEIGPEEGRKGVARMRQLVADRVGRPIRADIAGFPQDGWTFDDLLEVAEKRARSADASSSADERVA
jgi:hypothetical protein